MAVVSADSCLSNWQVMLAAVLLCVDSLWSVLGCTLRAGFGGCCGCCCCCTGAMGDAPAIPQLLAPSVPGGPICTRIAMATNDEEEERRGERTADQLPRVRCDERDGGVENVKWQLQGARSMHYTAAVTLVA